MENLIGTVTRVNGHGFIIEEREGWLNISKFAKPAPSLPEVGARVSISLDKSGYVRSIEPVQPEPWQAPEPERQAQAPSKDTVISRLAVLNTATAILASGGQTAEPTAVLALAGTLEAWAHR